MSDRQVFGQTGVPEAPVGSDEGERVSPSRSDGGHVQGDAAGGDAQREAVLAGVNPDVVTPHGSIGAAPWVLDSDWSMQLWGGGAWLSSTCQQRRDPTVLNL